MSWFFYKSSYLNSTLAMRTADGRLIGLVAGKHDQYFPFFHETCKWDNMLLYVDGLGVGYSASEIQGLEVKAIAERQAHITFQGDLKGNDGAMHTLEFALDFALAPGKQHTFAKLVNLPWLMGMCWQPYYCMLRPHHSRFVLDGKPLPLSHGNGELERGDLVNWKSRLFAFGYHYLCLVHPSDEYAIIDIQGRSAIPDLPGGKFMDWLFHQSHTTLLLNASTCTKAKLQGEPVIHVLIEDQVDLGLALLDRQFVLVRDAQNREFFGLREVFHPIKYLSVFAGR